MNEEETLETFFKYPVKYALTLTQEPLQLLAFVFLERLLAFNTLILNLSLVNNKHYKLL